MESEAFLFMLLEGELQKMIVITWDLCVVSLCVLLLNVVYLTTTNRRGGM